MQLSGFGLGATLFTCLESLLGSQPHAQKTRIPFLKLESMCYQIHSNRVQPTKPLRIESKTDNSQLTTWHAMCTNGPY